MDGVNVSGPCGGGAYKKSSGLRGGNNTPGICTLGRIPDGVGSGSIPVGDSVPGVGVPGFGAPGVGAPGVGAAGG